MHMLEVLTKTFCNSSELSLDRTKYSQFRTTTSTSKNLSRTQGMIFFRFLTAMMG
jgi:hypothetical protein